MILLMVASAASVGCTVNAVPSEQTPFNDPELNTGEQPNYKSSATGPIVEFDRAFGQPMEAWEIDAKGFEIYLNYSRFPYGTDTFRGQAVQVCTAVVGAYKFVGVAENSIRVRKAMMVVALRHAGTTPARFNCSTYEAMIGKNPASASLDKVFDSL